MQPAFGLVLAGGGAKGAYQAGVIQYLSEIGINPHIIAGTSIGALNGAILASSINFSEGVKKVNALWEKLGRIKIIYPNAGAATKITNYFAKVAMPNFTEWIINFLEKGGIIEDDDCLFDPKPIENFLREAIVPSQLRNGTELWIAAFPSLDIPGINYDILMAAIDLFRACIGTKAHWLRVQDCPDDETLYTLLLASAAIPLAFPKRMVNNQSYVDGSLADNVPLGALATRGITHAIVVHLENGSIWDRHEFPNQAIIEIRPIDPINKLDTPVIGNLDSLLDFSFERISFLKQRGYKDAKYYLEPIIRSFSTVISQRKTQESLTKSTQRLLNDKGLQ